LHACPVRRLEDADLHRRSALPCHGRALDHRCADEQGALRTWVETQLAPELEPGDVVILDNVAFHKSQRAAELVRQRGAWLLPLPPYSPDLNPIEMAFSKLKALLRKRAARSFDAICDALKDICALFDPEQCRNFFKAAGYEAN
jgi:transposase